MIDRAESLQAEYRLRFSGIEQYRNEVWKILCADFFARFISADAHVLDLGSGWGEFINNIRSSKKWAMDLNPDAAARLAKETRFLQQDCSLPWEVPSSSLDVVFTSNFLEHLPDKAHVERTVAEAHRCLRPGGRIICLGPNIRYLHGAYWDFWDHFVPLTDRSLAELLILKGFGIERSIPRFLPYSMSTGSTPPLITLRLHLRLPFFWRFLGKQFLVIGKKT